MNTNNKIVKIIKTIEAHAFNRLKNVLEIISILCSIEKKLDFVSFSVIIESEFSLLKKASLRIILDARADKYDESL